MLEAVTECEMEALRRLGAALGPSASDRDLTRLLAASERFLDPYSPGGYAENHRRLRLVTEDVRRSVTERDV